MHCLVVEGRERGGEWMKYMHMRPLNEMDDIRCSCVGATDTSRNVSTEDSSILGKSRTSEMFTSGLSTFPLTALL